MVARLVAARAVHLGDLEARLDGDVDGLRELREVALVDAERAVDVAAPARRARRPTAAPRARARDRPLRRRRARTRRPRARSRRPRDRRTRAASSLRAFSSCSGNAARNAVEHLGGRRPILELHERRRRVVLRGRANRRRRRALRDAQEVTRGRAIVLRLVGLLGLLVDRRREVVDERLPPLVLGRRQRRAPRRTRARPPDSRASSNDECATTVHAVRRSAGSAVG